MIPRAILTLLLLLLPGCAGGTAAPHPHRAEFTRICMGVPARIILYAESDTHARESAAAAFARIAAIEQVLSDYRDDSEAMRLCRQPPHTPHRVSDELFSILAISQELAVETGGAFDITLGPLTHLWRRSRATRMLPTPSDLAAAKAASGHHLLTLDHHHRTVTLARPDMLLDFGAIGKGHAAQQAVDLLRLRGTPRCLVALAGDIALGDPPPDRPGWTVAPGFRPVSSPALCWTVVAPGFRPVTSPSDLILSNCAISTSGDTEQFIDIDATRYAHIMNPATGLGLTTCPTITLIAPRGELADALATATCIRGQTAMVPILARHNARAVPLTRAFAQ